MSRACVPAVEGGNPGEDQLPQSSTWLHPGLPRLARPSGGDRPPPRPPAGSHRRPAGRLRQASPDPPDVIK